MRFIKDMSKGSTGSVGNHLVWARENGEIPWEYIVDETRSTECTQCWDDQAAFFRSMFQDYAKDHWATQPKRLVVWSEKATVKGTLVAGRYQANTPLSPLCNLAEPLLISKSRGC